MNKKAIWVLRIAVAGEFFAHGIFALQQREGWIPFFQAVGISPGEALALMPFIGILDVLLALLVLVKPIPIALLWMTLWGFWTALLRPLAGESIFEFVERWTNWGAPLALLLITVGWPKNIKRWFS